MSATTHVLYLHGFRSSPQSAKARIVAAWMQQHRPDIAWWCPQLPPSPREAIDMLLQGTSAWPRDTMAIIGSSLGGFYATVLAERLGCRAALLNPAVDPARDLAKYIGETTSWHSEDRFFFKPEYVDELKAMTPRQITRVERYFALIAKGDEVLDWREMHARYCLDQRVDQRADGPGLLLEGGDHAISDFPQHLPAVLAFLGLDR